MARKNARDPVTAETPTQRTIHGALDGAFAELNAKGIVAMQTDGYTMSDAWADVNEIATARRPVPRGATFFHAQDTERAMAGQGLWLAFGAYEDDPVEQQAASKRIATEVCETLKRWGVDATWDGDIDTRIHIPSFEWDTAKGRSSGGDTGHP
jgi:hypothetical protein